ncbi:MAG: hypothetical protein HY928_10370 [Elusimicrobia bacterium]|nr:hypothetical protein [Elusimicrobiota bacterium]
MTPRIDERLKVWRRQRFAALWLEGGSRLSVWSGGLVMAAAAADRAFGLPHGLRLALFAAGLAAFAAACAAWLLKPLGAWDAGRILDAAAARWPQGRGLLRSAWELGRSPLPENTSAALARRHMADAEAAAGGLPDDVLFPALVPAPLRRRLGAVACCWAVGVPLIGGTAPLARVVAPWLENPLELELEVVPGDARVAWGSSPELRVGWRAGFPAAPLALELRPEAGAWARAVWDKEAAGQWSWRAESLNAPLQYRFVSRDRSTRAFRLDPIPYPRFERLSARVRRPGGAEEEVSLEGASVLAALRGSWVEVRGVPDRPLDEAALEVSGLGGPVPMKRGQDGVWSAGFPLRQDGTLRVRASAEGVGEPEPPAFQLRALEDRPPEVVLLSPAFPVETSRRERVPVAYEARDDFGLAAVSLVYSVDAGPERVQPLSGLKPGAASHLGEHEWDLSALPDGARIEFRLRAVDNARPEPQTAVSQAGLIVLADFEALHASVERRGLAAEAALGVLAEEERAMREALSAAAALPDAERAARAEDLARRESALSRDWAQAVRGVEQFSKAMEQDPYANPGAAESAAALAQALEGMRRGELAEARKAQKAGDLAASERGHEALEKKVRRAGELLSGGREVQAMQDLWGEAERMERSGQDLAGALEQLAKGARPSAEEVKKLDAALAELQKRMDELAKVVEGLPKAAADSPAERRRKVYTVPLGAAQETMDALSAAMARGDYAEAARLAQELSRRLGEVSRAVSKAARDFAESEDQSPAKRLSELESAWKEAAAAQERALESVAAVEESRLAARTQAQERLREQLIAEQREAVKEGERLGRWLPPGPMPDMRVVLAELEGRRIREAPERLERAASRLEAQAKALTPEGTEPTEAARGLSALAAKERDVLRRLKEADAEAAMTEEQLSQAMAAGAVQRQASRKAAELSPMVDGLSRDYGLDLGEAEQSLRSARSEQAGAEESLSKRATGAARAAQERALEHLRRGAESAQKSRERAQSAQSGAGRPFGRPRGTARPMGRGGETGADKSFVPLPGVEEYQPPRVIRGEVEKSLHEKRPPAFDKAVDEYLRRLSQ